MTEEREEMELDVLFIGAGPANLAAACRLMQAVNAHNEKAEAEGKPTIEEPMILVVDKGAEVGSHTLSGAVVDPVSFRELFPDVAEADFPFITPVTSDRVNYLTPKGKLPVPGPMLPKAMHNSSDCRIASISEMTRWLAAQCEELGVEVYTEFAVDELMIEDGRVVGAKVADKGRDKNGEPGESFAPGMDLTARVTVIGEGTRGYVAEQLIEQFGLRTESNPQSWGLGLKEVIEIPAGRVKPGAVIHTFGYPLDMRTYGGSFLYALDETTVALGLVFGLDYVNPLFESHAAFLQYKKHPMVASIIEGGKVLEYGAKTLPEGGLYALPRLAVDGAVLVGDSAGFLNVMRLKGVHLAMKSGMLAADRIAAALAKEEAPTAADLDYCADFDASWAGKELFLARNFRQGFHGGMIPGMIGAGMHMVSGGALPGGRKRMAEDWEGMKPASAGKKPPKIATDENLYVDLLTDVYKSGSVHREDQPTHCDILDEAKCFQCWETYQSPCTRFCPAQVYEAEFAEDGKFQGIQVNFSNCVHCKTCEIKDPLRNLKWNPPDGGEGPKYQRM